MNKFNFTGLGVALVTPFTADSANVDWNCLETLVDRLVDNGTDYLVVLGTTAETPTLNPSEKAHVRDSVARVVNGRIPLVLGWGGNCTKTLCQELSEWNGAGYDAILSVTPFYNKPSQTGMYCHFKAVAEASPVPVLLYNVPGRTGVNLLPETVSALAANVPGIVGIKEASGNLHQVAELSSSVSTDFAIVSGDDGITAEMIELGARGVISVIGNALPSYWGRLTHLAMQGHTEEAKKLQHDLAPLLRMLFAEGNPSGIKALMNILKLCENTLRLPLVPVSEELQARMANFVESHNIIH